MNFKSKWNDEDTKMARRMLLENATEEEFIEAFGRGRKSAQDRMRHVDGLRHRDRRRSAPVHTDAIAHPKGIPADVIEDALKRACAERSITSLLCGDPAPGWSALDKRELRA